VTAPSDKQLVKTPSVDRLIPKFNQQIHCTQMHTHTTAQKPVKR